MRGFSFLKKYFIFFITKFYWKKKYPKKFMKYNDFKQLSCVTFGSLNLEESMQDDLSSLNAQIIDMECSAFFNAASHSKLEALALLYISDIIETQPFYTAHNALDQKRIIKSIDAGAQYIKSFLNV